MLLQMVSFFPRFTFLKITIYRRFAFQKQIKYFGLSTNCSTKTALQQNGLGLIASKEKMDFFWIRKTRVYISVPSGPMRFALPYW